MITNKRLNIQAMEENKLNKFGLTEGIFLAIIPALGYMVAFIFELSFAEVYGYPISFISLGLETVIIAILTVFGFFVSIYVIFDFMAGIIKSKYFESQLGQFIFWGTFLYSLWALILFIGDSGWNGWSMFTLFFISEFLFELLIPFFSKVDSQNFAERFVIFRNREIENIRLSNRFLSKLNSNISYVLLLVLIAISSAYALGKYTAKNTESFFIVNDDKQKVVLRVSSNYLIVASIDSSTNYIKKYSIIDALKSDISISKIKLGNLIKTPDEIENTKTLRDSLKTL